MQHQQRMSADEVHFLDVIKKYVLHFVVLPFGTEIPKLPNIEGMAANENPPWPVCCRWFAENPIFHTLVKHKRRKQK